MTYPPRRVIENLDNLCLLVLRSKLSTLKHSTLLLSRKKVYHTNTTFPLIPMRFHSLAVCFTACSLCSFAFLTPMQIYSISTAACLLRVFAKGRRNNGVLYVQFMGLFFPQWFFLPVLWKAHSLCNRLGLVAEQSYDFFLEVAVRTNALFQICQIAKLGVKFHRS